MKKIATPDEIITLSDILHFGEKCFAKAKLYYGHGTDNAWDEAVFIALSYLEFPFADNTHLLTYKLKAKEKKAILELFDRRIKERIPAPYLVNKAWFCGLEFFVDERVLIPRSPISELIQSKFAPWVEADKVRNILDIGTGSGAIAIACAKAFPDAQVDAVDIDAKALQVAKRNVKKHQVKNQVKLIKSDLFAKLGERRYDIIVSNPPYVESAEMGELPKEYYHEPSHALEAGQDGLDIVRRILRDAKEHLTENGILIVEVAQSRAALEKAFPNLPFVWLEFEHGGDGVFLINYQSPVISY